MNNRIPLSSFFAVCVAIAALLAGTAHSQVGPPKQYVALQPNSPGTSQSGNANLSGTISSSQLVTGGFTMSTGAGAGKVLTSNALGVASWQTPSILAPYVLNGNDLFPTFKATNSGIGYAIYGESSGSNASAVRGLSTHATLGYGIVGEAYGTQSIGVAGVYSNNTGTGAGVEGWTSSSTGIGVRGINTNPAFGTAVYGEAIGQSSYGVHGYANNISGNGRGVYGQANSFGAVGVYGYNSGNGRGVLGIAGGTSGTGVYGRVDSGSSGQEPAGVRGLCLGQTGIAGLFEGPTGIYAASLNDGYAAHLVGLVQVVGNVGVGSIPGNERLRIFGSTADVQAIYNTGGGRGLFVSTNSDTGIWSTTGSGFAGVDGRTGSSSGYGIYGFNSNSSGTGSGVVGQTATSSGFGVYSIGNFGASGTKSFRIDHPLDPENKYLLHYSSESPYPQNFYNGNITTDGMGYAWVQLPDYFEEININFKYQLTVVDDADSKGFVLAKVSKEIRGGRFQIRTSEPNIKVSWRVDADRNDPWVRQNGAPSEVEKSEEDKGTYQHPELYGQPASRGELYRKRTRNLVPSVKGKR